MRRAGANRAGAPRDSVRGFIVNRSRGRFPVATRRSFEAAFVLEQLAVFCDGDRYHLHKDQWRRDQRQRKELVRLGSIRRKV